MFIFDIETYAANFEPLVSFFLFFPLVYSFLFFGVRISKVENAATRQKNQNTECGRHKLPILLCQYYKDYV